MNATKRTPKEPSIENPTPLNTLADLRSFQENLRRRKAEQQSKTISDPATLDIRKLNEIANAAIAEQDNLRVQIHADREKEKPARLAQLRSRSRKEPKLCRPKNRSEETKATCQRKLLLKKAGEAGAYVRWPESLNHSAVSLEARGVFLCMLELRNRALELNKTASFFANYEYFQGCTGLSRDKICAVVKELTERHILEYHRGHSEADFVGKRPNEYKIRPPSEWILN